MFMKYSFRYKNRFLKILSSVLYDLPAPVNLSIMWNFGSLLGVCLIIQIITGLLMAVHYTPEVEQAFASVIHIMRDVKGGWLLRSIHANGASFFFMCIYLHIGRGIFYHSFFMKNTWMTGCTILIFLMAIAFTGYVLPWGQMSFWGATVITNLFSAIPYIGNDLVSWMWGGFCVGDATLKRFFVFHFLGPFILFMLVGIHIVFLHDTGSGNPLGVESDVEAIPFHSYYLLKDLVGIVFMVGCLLLICLCAPDIFLDPVNFMPADPMKTPLHIQPEWYFLFAYCILRSIPNKLGGVVALAMSVVVLYFLPFYPKTLWRGIGFNPLGQFLFWIFVGNFIILTFIGSCPIEPPFEMIGRWSSVIYFVFFVLYPVSWFTWEDMILNDGNNSEVK
nr:cytochrome b [Chamelea gallina]UJH93122.1 cytochrome b [Venus verrucosa]UJH93148.1 cytochrome b [Venus verrucosa]UJH93174.1 cytochrome b [Venus verrucosa]UJH93200.1 cytochrome b [Venus verrucosa]